MLPQFFPSVYWEHYLPIVSWILTKNFTAWLAKNGDFSRFIFAKSIFLRIWFKKYMERSAIFHKNWTLAKFVVFGENFDFKYVILKDFHEKFRARKPLFSWYWVCSWGHQLAWRVWGGRVTALQGSTDLVQHSPFTSNKKKKASLSIHPTLSHNGQ